MSKLLEAAPFRSHNAPLPRTHPKQVQQLSSCSRWSCPSLYIVPLPPLNLDLVPGELGERSRGGKRDQTRPTTGRPHRPVEAVIATAAWSDWAGVLKKEWEMIGSQDHFNSLGSTREAGKDQLDSLRRGAILFWV